MSLNTVHRVDFDIDIDRVKQLTHKLIKTINIYDDFIVVCGLGCGYIIRMQKVGKESHLYVEHRFGVTGVHLPVHRLDSNDYNAHRYIYKRDNKHAYIVSKNSRINIFESMPYTIGVSMYHEMELNNLFCINGEYYDRLSYTVININNGFGRGLYINYSRRGKNYFIYCGQTYILRIEGGWLYLDTISIIRGDIRLVQAEVLCKMNICYASCRLMYSVNHNNSATYPTSYGFSILGFINQHDFVYTVIPNVNNIGKLNMMNHSTYCAHLLPVEVYGRTSTTHHETPDSDVKHLRTYISVPVTMWSRAADPSAAYYDTYIIC